MFNFAKKGFTLIELLVVIAVLGILASVVLVAINPSERIKEARDTGVKSDVDQVMQAVQACYTQQAASGGDYHDCNTLSELETLGYLKSASAMSGVTIASTADDAIVYEALEATSAKPSGCSGTYYWVAYTDGTSTGAVCTGNSIFSTYTNGTTSD